MLKYYNSLDNCPIWNFNKIAETGDLRWLMRDYDTDIKGCDLEAVYLKVTNDYRNSKQGKNNDNDLIIGIQRQILALQLKHHTIKIACFNLEFNPCNEKMHEVLKSFGYIISPDRSEIEQLLEIDHRASNMITKWKEKEFQYKEMTKDVEDKERIPFDEYVKMLEDSLGRDLHVKTMSVNEWSALEAVIKRKNEQKA